MLANGSFGFHENEIIGVLAGPHSRWRSRLQDMLNHLLVLTTRGPEALRDLADGYEDTGKHAAARVDASYPEAPRTSSFRD